MFVEEIRKAGRKYMMKAWELEWRMMGWGMGKWSGKAGSGVQREQADGGLLILGSTYIFLLIWTGGNLDCMKTYKKKCF